jgi:hypothetical protein
MFFILIVQWQAIKYRYVIIVLFSFFCVAPLLFTNLYYEHNYYWYANSLFICLAFGLLILSFIESDDFPKKLFGYFLTGLLALYMYTSYIFLYYVQILPPKSHDTPKTIAEIVKENTKSDDVLFILGVSYSSEIPYYSERKALCYPFPIPKTIDHADLFKNFESSNIKVLLIVHRYEDIDDATIAIAIKHLKMNPKPVVAGKQVFSFELYKKLE